MPPKRQTASRKRKDADDTPVAVGAEASPAEAEEPPAKQRRTSSRTKSKPQPPTDPVESLESIKKSKTSRSKKTEPPPPSDDTPPETPSDSPTSYSSNQFTNTTLPTDLSYDPAPPNHLKIISWNIAGIGACVKKGFRRYLDAENADIVCLQETKLGAEPGEEYVPKEAYPYQYWTHSTAKKGYAGSAVLSKVEPIFVKYGIDVEEFDDEGRIISLEFKDWYLIACYIPNSGMKLERLEYKQRYNKAMETYIRDLEKKKPIVWAGDLNVAHKEVDLARSKTNKKSVFRTPGFTQEERDDFERILTSDPPLIDTYRHLHPDTHDRFTYYSYRFNCRQKNIGWRYVVIFRLRRDLGNLHELIAGCPVDRLDYFVTSEKLLSHVVESDIRSEAYGASDHVPIYMIIRQ
ncbi:hypothetical protein HK097_009593 [Rhizophlyctis rosea]|uniref:DNA-(apurinic or apyrimidinic site) endonuclease n=1 Tax=Rhizophlyctis rosea TaxID=64517 RepID=A0AAD5SGV4_9FUNG|nr:hypothetical protein HK097_009593 [Rhizophlyctis rosea]